MAAGAREVQGSIHSMIKIFLAISLYALVTVSASAATLDGKVIEVNDGDTVTIVNLNRPLKVEILGVIAPEAGQAYAEVARQHLSDLILNRTIVVTYSGFVQNNYILGKVYYKDMDIGAQMLRDGVAWFDKSANSRLTDSEKEIYSGSELAARSERRGLWQDATPIPPWEFKKQQETPRSPTAQVAPSVKAVDSEKTDNSTLSSEDLLQGFGGGSHFAKSKMANGETGWRKFAPEGQHFSVQVPGSGYEASSTQPIGDKVANLNYWFADFNGATYLLMWAEGPNLKYTDTSAIESVANSLVLGLNRGFEKRGLTLEFGAKREGSLKLDGYNGSQFDLAAANIPGVLRVYSKQFGDQREMYLVGVLNATDKNESAQRFLNSLSFKKEQ